MSVVEKLKLGECFTMLVCVLRICLFFGWVMAWVFFQGYLGVPKALQKGEGEEIELCSRRS